MKHSMTDGKRLASLIEKGIPFKGGVYLDTNNQTYNTMICGCIKARINSNNMYFVTPCVETE